MDMWEARRQHQAWGDKPCTHPKLEAETLDGVRTGDYACTACGLAAWGEDWNKKTRKKTALPSGAPRRELVPPRSIHAPKRPISTKKTKRKITGGRSLSRGR